MIVSLMGASVVISEGACQLQVATWCQHLSKESPSFNLFTYLDESSGNFLLRGKHIHHFPE